MKKHLLLHHQAAERFGERLRAYGFTAVPLPSEPRLNPIVASHADTLIFDGLSAPILNEAYAQKLPSAVREKCVTVSASPMGAYPTDAVFNAALIGGCLYGRLASLSPVVREEALSMGLRLVDVRQGYARCSTLLLPSRQGAITADEGIASAMEANGVQILRISQGSIALDGCDYGFIGGASFVDDSLSCCSLHAKPTVYFFGELNRHPDNARIRDFIEARGYDIVCLGGALTDFGGAVIVR